VPFETFAFQALCHSVFAPLLDMTFKKPNQLINVAVGIAFESDCNLPFHNRIHHAWLCAGMVECIGYGRLSYYVRSVRNTVQGDEPFALVSKNFEPGGVMAAHCIHSTPPCACPRRLQDMTERTHCKHLLKFSWAVG
jgi:hypothetical protein